MTPATIKAVRKRLHDVRNDLCGVLRAEPVLLKAMVELTGIVDAIIADDPQAIDPKTKKPLERRGGERRKGKR
jgi:hypothetical protein